MFQDRLNDRPRKRLGFKIVSEVFTQSIYCVALRMCICNNKNSQLRKTD